MVAAYRDERLKNVKGETVRRELTVLRHCIELATLYVRSPSPPPSKVRGRRLPKGAEAYLMAALAQTRVRYLRPLIILALEQGCDAESCLLWNGLMLISAPGSHD